MKVLVTGYGGQLGYDVVHKGLNQDLKMIGLKREDLDIINREEVSHYVNEMKPDAIIHCAAYTAVDKAEDEKEMCWDVNVEGTKYLAKAARDVNAKFMYISTDYVFNGEGDSPFKEEDELSPVGYYGETKYQGEEVLKQLMDKWFIIRISWVFGVNGANFVKTMLRLAETKNELNIVGDQFGSPTYTFDLAPLLIEMIQTNRFGIYHASNEGTCSWAEFAEEIFRQSNKDVKVHSISTEEYPTRAVRPKNSRLSKQKLGNSGFMLLPHWKDAIGRYINEFKQEVR